MEWAKKHLDTAFIILSIITSVLILNNNINQKFNEIEKDLAVIKAVLIMKGIMPQELATK